MLYEAIVIGRKAILKSLAISKLLYLGLLPIIQNSVLEELKKYRKPSYGKIKQAKVKHDTLYSGLKSVDIKHEIPASKCSWIQRL